VENTLLGDRTQQQIRKSLVTAASDHRRSAPRLARTKAFTGEFSAITVLTAT
jgi:hypothetical protein